MEVSAHTVSRAYMNELKFVFPSVELDNVIVIPTMQCSQEDLVRIGDAVENEKDRLLERVSNCCICFLFCRVFLITDVLIFKVYGVGERDL